MESRKYGWLIFLFSFQCIFINVNGQNSLSHLQFNYLTIEEGLPNNKVNAIEMDNDGFMWFATNDGVCRFDGLDVKKYVLSDYTLAEGEVRTSLANRVLIDEQGEILIGAYSLFYHNKITDKFELYPFKNTSDPLKRIRAIEKDSNSRIWIGDQTGLYSFQSDVKDSLTFYPYSDNETIDISVILPLGDSLLIGTSSRGVLIFDILKKRFTPFSLFKETDNKYKALCFFKDDGNTIWMGTNNNGIYTFNLQHSIVKHIYLESENDFSNRVRDIVKDNLGNIWFGSRGGLYKKDFKTKEIKQCANEEHPFSKLSSNSIYDIFIDKNQGFWLGTYSGGVNYGNLNRKPFAHFSAQGKGSSFLNSNVVTCFCEDIYGNIFIGTHDGVNFFDRKKGEFTYYLTSEDKANSLSYSGIKSMVCETSGNIWIGTNLEGLNYFNPKTKVVRNFFHEPNNSKSLNSNNVNCLMLDDDQNLWVATDAGIDMLPYGETNFQHIYTGRVNFLYRNKEGDMWAGTYGDGLYLYNDNLKIFEKYFYEVFFNTSIITMLIDSEKNLWVGGNKGITYINTGDSSMHTYGRKDGLPTNITMGIQEDDQKNLWISTTSGLLKYEKAVLHPDSLNFTIFSLADGIQSNQFYPFSYMKSSSGEMLFGGINGYNMFTPELIKDNEIAPKLAFTGFKIFNKVVQVGQEIEGSIVLSKPLSETQDINLSYKHRVITLDFVALHYANPKQNKYRYRLMPLEKEWNYTTADRSDATYTNLEGGEYTFMVEASNSDGLWSSEQLNLTITVSPPFWKTIWFISLAIFVLIVSIVSYYLHRIASLKRYNITLEQEVSDRTEELQKQKEALQEINLTKDKLFSIIAHDLRSPFQALLGFVGILESDFYEIDEEKKFSYIQYISQSANNVYNLLTNLLTWSRAQSSRISCEPEVLDLLELTDQTLELLKTNYENKSIIVINLVSKGVKVTADKNMAETVFRNIISNAVKFTPINGQIIINAVQFDSMIQVSIKDTGIGMSETEANNLFSLDKTESRPGTSGESGTGLGLLICKDFVLKNGGRIWVESEIEKGSTFYFTLKKADSSNT